MTKTNNNWAVTVKQDLRTADALLRDIADCEGFLAEARQRGGAKIAAYWEARIESNRAQLVAS